MHPDLTGVRNRYGKAAAEVRRVAAEEAAAGVLARQVAAEQARQARVEAASREGDERWRAELSAMGMTQARLERPPPHVTECSCL